MVLKFKSKSCKIELGSEYSVDQFKDDVCSVTFAKCWEKEIYGGEIFDYYDFMCACKTFDSRKALELLKEVIVKNKPEYAIVTIAPFDHPAGPLYSYNVESIPPKALWVRRDVMFSVLSTSLDLGSMLRLLVELCRDLVDKDRGECVSYYNALFYHPLMIPAEVFERVLERVAEKFADGFLIVNPVDDVNYYCEFFFEVLGSSECVESEK